MNIAVSHKAKAPQQHSQKPAVATFVFAASKVAARLRPTPGANSASAGHWPAIDSAVLGSILRISLNQGLDPVASIGARVRFEIVDFTAVVGATVLDLVRRVVLVILRR